MVVRYLGDGEWKCVDADTKPANAAVGDKLTVTDMRRVYIKTGPTSDDWMDIEHNPMTGIETLKLGKYFVYNYNEGEEYRLYDHNFMLMESGADLVVDVLQPMIDMLPDARSIEFSFDGDDFEATTPLVCPASATTQPRLVRLKGYPTLTRASGTLIHAATAFPDNRFFIETSGGGPSTGLQPFVHIDGLNFYNLNFKDEAATAGRKNVGGIQYESDGIGRRSCIVENCWFQYLWRGLELRGAVWWSYFRNLIFSDANADFVGESDIRLGDGGHTGAVNPSPKENRFTHIECIHTGRMNQSLIIRAGGYNKFDGYHVSGEEYVTAVWNLTKLDTLTIHNNRFNMLDMLDVDTVPTPDVRKGTILLSGTGNVVDNEFRNVYTNPYPYNIVLEGAGVFNNYIEHTAQHSTLPLSVNDVAGVGGNNVIKVIGSNSLSAVGNLPITTVSGLVRIIDERKGAERSYASTIGDGGIIAHGLMTTPAWVVVTPSIAGEIATVTSKDATNFTVAIKKWTTGALTAGTSQTVYWRAGIYLT